MNTNWRAAPGVSVTEDGGSLILLSPTGTYYGLDDLGRLLWYGMAQGGLEPALEKIHQTYGVPLEVVRRDAEALFQELQKAGLIQRDA